MTTAQHCSACHLLLKCARRRARSGAENAVRQARLLSCVGQDTSPWQLTAHWLAPNLALEAGDHVDAGLTEHRLVPHLHERAIGKTRLFRVIRSVTRLTADETPNTAQRTTIRQGLHSAHPSDDVAKVIGVVRRNAGEVDVGADQVGLVVAADALQRRLEVVGRLTVPHRPVCKQRSGVNEVLPAGCC